MAFIECFQSMCSYIKTAFVVYIMQAWVHVHSIVTRLNCSAGERALNLKKHFLDWHIQHIEVLFMTTFMGNTLVHAHMNTHIQYTYTHTNIYCIIWNSGSYCNGTVFLYHITHDCTFTQQCWISNDHYSFTHILYSNNICWNWHFSTWY